MTSWDIKEDVAGYVWKAPSPRAQVLLQHGYGEYAERYINQYSGLIPKLNKNGFDVYAIDLPGHGNSKGERGLIGRRQQVSSEHLFDIANRSPVATMIEVFDRYPTAVNDDVEVTIPRTATPPTDRDVEDRPGVVVWRKTLDAGATWQITHAYEMSYPVGRTLVGARP